MIDYSDILLDVNFTGGAGKALLYDNGDSRSDVDLVSGKYRIYFYDLKNAGELSSLTYYDSNSFPNSNPTADGNPALNPEQSSILQTVLDSTMADHYSVRFSDVANVEFSYGSTTNAHIIVGQYNETNQSAVANTYNNNLNNNTGSIAPLQHGDIWINDNYRLGWDQIADGTAQNYGILHELAHSLGLDHPTLNSDIDTHQYTIMSYKPLVGMGNLDGNDKPTDDTVTPFGLQLLDIAAIQAIYGTNTTTRGEDNTQYSKLTAFASSRPNEAFVYTIWDGGGTGDTIDASGFIDGVEINLNDGEFSSIGKSADATYAGSRGTGLADNNVAIAYNAKIENAIGTVGNDHIIGNDLDNVIVVGAGTDTVVGHDGIDTLDYHDDLTGNGMSISIAENNGPTNGTIIDGWGDTDYFADIENFILTEGDDIVDVIQTGIIATDSIFDGGDGHDKYTNTTGILEVKGDELWVWDEFGHTHDVLKYFEEVHVDRIIPSLINSPEFTTLLANGSSFKDIDYRDISLAPLTFNVGGGALQVTGGGITHNYLTGDTVNVVGNNADNTYNVTGITKNIYTGTGNDTVVVNSSASNVRIYYSGGNDSYSFLGGSLEGIRIGGSIVGSNISVQSSMLHGYDYGYQVILNVAGYGVITIDHNAPVFDTTVFEPTVLTFNNGDTYTIQRDLYGGVSTTLMTSGGVIGGGDYHPAESGYGTWGDDTWTTSATGGGFRAFGGNDVITSGASTNTSDTIYGGSGLDTLIGGAGNDILYGGDDTDHLDGGTGTNTLYGGLGGDVFYVGEGYDIATGGEGADTYIIKSEAGNGGSLTISDFDVSEDRIDLSLLGDAESFNTLPFNNYATGVEFYIANNNYKITLTGVDRFSLTESNFMFGSANAPYVYAPPPLPSSTVQGDADGNIIDESNSNFGLVIDGLGGDDEITGTFYTDYIYGGTGGDTINGDYGSDVLYGNDGSDTLRGGNGNDFYFFNTDTDTGFDTIEEWDGTDTIVFEGSLTTSDIDMYQSGLDLVLEGFNNTQSQYWVVQITSALWDGLNYDAKIEYIVVQDVVYDLAEVYNTGVWTPYVADTTVAPNAFDDLITIDRGGVVRGNLLNDNGNGADYDPDGTYLEVDPFTATGAYGSFHLYSDGSFTFVGTQNYVGTEILTYTLRDADGVESTANITLNSIVTNEAPVAQNMDSVVAIQAGSALNFVPNFTDPDGDAITYSATLQDGSALPSYITIDTATGALTGTMLATSQASIGVRLIAADWMSQTTYDFDLDVYDVITGTTALDYLHGDAGVDTIYGGDGEDRLYGNDGDDELHGENDNDRIYGHLGNDTIYGDSGWDLLYGLQGDDIIFGGIGNDTIRGDDASGADGYVGAGNDEIHGGDGGDNILGGAGADTLYGDAGNDTIYGNAGADTVYGGNDNDYIYGNAGDDELHGDAGIDRIYGHAGNDVIYGDADDDLLYGLEGDDILYGGDGDDRVIGDDDPATAGFVDAGNDVLLGEGGNDVLGGGAGDDLLIGGTGVDALYGNAGADTFAYLLGDLDGSKDYIHDFSIAEGDVINIADVIDYSLANGDAIADFVTIYNGGSYVRVIVDQDGTGTAHTTLDVAQVQGHTGWDLNTLITSGTLIVE